MRDYRIEGQRLWERFGSRTAEDQLGYYTRMLELFAARREGPLVEDLHRAVGELAELISDRRDGRIGPRPAPAPARMAGGPDERSAP